MSGFSVVIKDPASPPLAAEGLLMSRGLGRDKARNLLRRQPGFLGRGLDLAGARELAAAAEAAGFPVMICAEDEIPEPPVPVRPSKVTPKGTGFEVTAGGGVTFIHFESVSVFAAGAYDAPVQPADLEGLKAGLFSRLAELAGLAPRPAPAQRKETFFRADIIAGGGLRLLLTPEELDFSGLGSRTHSSLTNFRLLLDAISGPCYKSVKNSFLAAFTASRPVTMLKLADPAACDAELSRLILLARPKA